MMSMMDRFFRALITSKSNSAEEVSMNQRELDIEVSGKSSYTGAECLDTLWVMGIGI